MKQHVLAGAVALIVVPFTAYPQQAAPATNCVSQYEDLAGKSAASLVSAGYSVSAAVPGGLWLLKGKEVAYCNVTNRLREGEMLCWTLREPGVCRRRCRWRWTSRLCRAAACRPL